MAGFLSVVFIWRLGSLTPGLSPAEVAARNASLSLRTIYHQPVDAPLKIVQHFLLKIDSASLIYLRAASVAFAIIFAICFYRLAVGWFGRFIGLLAALVFVSLPLFVISAHQASAEVLLFWPVLLLWLYYKPLKTEQLKPLIWLALIVVAGLSLYVPGMVWWLAAGIIIGRKRIFSTIRTVPAWLSTIGALVMLGSLAPLILSAISRPAILKNLALVPEHWFNAVRTLENIGWMVLALFVKTPTTNPLILGRMPLLNVILAALLVFGAYAMYIAAKPKAYSLGLSVLFAILAAGLNNDVILLALGLPAIALFISAGLRYLYIEWRSIFPTNPVPKTFAWLLIIAVVASQLFFGLRYSLVAWPDSASTRAAYVLK
jgi:4-amino-4-deoxy-L-arabinose transferase-like glycosyltransferase